MGHEVKGQMQPYATEHLSLSRLARRERCTRADWWHVEGARGGYRDDAPVLARRAYHLKRLSSLSGLIGQLLHEMAARRAQDVRDGRRPLDEATAWRLMRARLNRAVGYPRRESPGHRDSQGAGEAGAGRPAQDPATMIAALGDASTPLLREVWLGEWPDGAIPLPVAQRAAHYARIALHRMMTHPVWAHLAECSRGAILRCDALDALALEIDGAHVELFAAPDLVWIAGQQTELPCYAVPVLPPILHILDWKSGPADRWREAGRGLLASYAAWVLDKHPDVTRATTVVGWIAALGGADGVEDLHFVLSAAEIGAARERLRLEGRRIADQRGPDGRVPIESTRRNLEACRFCPFPPVCLEGGEADGANAPMQGNARPLGPPADVTGGQHSGERR